MPNEIDPNATDFTPPAFITVPKLARKYNWLSLSTLRRLLFDRNTNGFDACVVKFGRRLLIDEIKFFDWIEEQNRKNSAA